MIELVKEPKLDKDALESYLGYEIVILELSPDLKKKWCLKVIRL